MPCKILKPLGTKAELPDRPTAFNAPVPVLTMVGVLADFSDAEVNVIFPLGVLIRKSDVLSQYKLPPLKVLVVALELMMAPCPLKPLPCRCMVLLDMPALNPFTSKVPLAPMVTLELEAAVVEFSFITPLLIT